MSIELSLAIRGNFLEWKDEVARVVDKGGRIALRKATFGLRKDVVKQIKSGGFRSAGLTRSVSAKVSGSGADLEGRVASKALYKPGGVRGQSVDLIALFAEGATITPLGKWLAVPTFECPKKASGRGGSRFATPQELVAMGWKLAFLPTKRGNAVIVATSPGKGKILTHVLLRHVTLRSRYSLYGEVQRVLSEFPTIIAEEIDKAASESAILNRVGA